MCTVTFLPTDASVGGYLLTTNRDESPSRRPASPPESTLIGGRAVLLPRDAEAGGTWIAVDDAGRAVCLLNGDRPRPSAGTDASAPPSRGLLVLDLMEDPRPAIVADRLRERIGRDALPYRAFKLLVIDPTGGPGEPAALHMDWDTVEWSQHSVEGPGLLVSSTFRREDVNAHRARAWDALLEQLPADHAARRERMVGFHGEHGPQGADAFGVCVHREDARTVSSTMVEVGPGEVAMHYRAGWPCEAGAPVSARVPRRP